MRQHLRELTSIISILELTRAEDAMTLDAAQAHDLTGDATMVDFLSRECGLMPEAAQDRLTLGRQLAALPATAEGLASGQLSLDTAALVARSAEGVRPEKVGEVEAGILTAARLLAPAGLRRAAATIRAEADREAFEAEAGRARRHRCVRIGPERDGLATISGRLTAVAAAHLRAALEPYMKPRHGSDDRTAAQRRHDALEQVCRQGGKAHVQIVAQADEVLGEGRQAALLEGLIPVSRDELRRMMEGGASISAVLKDLKGNLLYAGRARNLSAAQWRVLTGQVPTCVFKGCNRPAAQSQAHHLTEHCRGGPTAIGDEAPLCAAHQERVHRDGWWVRKESDGTYATLSPGHPDNPTERLSPAIYTRNVARAMRQRPRAEAPRPGPAP